VRRGFPYFLRIVRHRGKDCFFGKLFQTINKRKGLISSVMDEIRKLEERINFRLSVDLKQHIKEQAGE
jgi:hypothetical protein